MSIWVFLLILGLALLTGLAARAKAAAGAFIVSGFLLGAAHADEAREALGFVADLFS